MMKSKSKPYYAALGLFSLIIVGTGLANIMQVEAIVASYGRIGFPPYFSYLAGMAFIGAIVGLWQNVVPVLREWAYAGLTYIFAGGIVAHLITDQAFMTIVPAILFLLFLLVIYTLDKRAE